MSDWTTARVVRDGKGRLRTDDGPIRGLVGDGLVSAESAAAYEHMLGPLTPVLDADGLPVVRTVGDLTARHQLARPRIRVAEREGRLKIVKPSDMYPGTVALIWGDWWEDVSYEEPCEVLP